jgi:pyridoxal phosphate enzyme (YggS family)
MSIAKNYRKLREEIPDNVTIVLAGKTRTAEEIVEAIEAGATDIGENYVQEGAAMHEALGARAKDVTWHMIGHLQTNKINKALRVFDVIQTVDSLKKAIAIDKRVEAAGKSVLPVCIEINIGNEDSKAGIDPEEHEPFEEYMESLVYDMSSLVHLRLAGLMTMGPRFGNPEDARPYFSRTKKIFDRIRALAWPNVDMRYLSMGMTNSYRIAIAEGSNIVRIGSGVFGERTCQNWRRSDARP